MESSIAHDLEKTTLGLAPVGCSRGTNTRTLFCTSAASEATMRAWIAQTQPQRERSEGHGNVVVNAHLSRGVPPTENTCDFLTRAHHGDVGNGAGKQRLHGGMRLVYSPAIAGMARMIAVEGVALQLSMHMVMPDDVTAKERAHSVRDLKDALDRLGDFAPLLEYDGPYAWPGGRKQAERINGVALAISERAAQMNAELVAADTEMDDASKADRAARPNVEYQRDDPLQFKLMSESAFKRRLKMRMQQLLYRLSMEVVILNTYKVLWIAAAEQFHAWLVDRIDSRAITHARRSRYVRRSDGEVVDVAQELKTFLLDGLLGPISEDMRPLDWVLDARQVAMALSGDASSQAMDVADAEDLREKVFRLSAYRDFVQSVLHYTEKHLLPYATCATPADVLEAPNGHTGFDRSLFLTGFDQPSRPDDAFSLEGPLVSGLKGTPGSVRTMMQKIKKKRRLAENGSDERRVFDEGMRALQRKYGQPQMALAHDTQTRADRPVSGIAPHSGEPFGLFAPRATLRSLAWQRWALLSDSAVMSGAVATFCPSSQRDLTRKAAALVPEEERRGVPVGADYATPEQHGELLAEVAKTMRAVMDMMNDNLPPGPDGGPMIKSMEHVTLRVGPAVRALPKPHSKHGRQVHRVLSATVPMWAIVGMLGYEEASREQSDALEASVRAVLQAEGPQTTAAAVDPTHVMDAVAGGADWSELKQRFALSSDQTERILEQMVSIDVNPLEFAKRMVTNAGEGIMHIVQRGYEAAKRVAGAAGEVAVRVYAKVATSTGWKLTSKQAREAVLDGQAEDWFSLGYRFARAQEARTARYLMLLPEALVQLMMQDYHDDAVQSSHRRGTPALSLHGTMVIPRAHASAAPVDQRANAFRPGLEYAWRWSGTHSARSSAEERRDPFKQLDADTQVAVETLWNRWSASGHDLAVNHQVSKRSGDHDAHVASVLRALGTSAYALAHESYDVGQEQICTYAALENEDLIYGAQLRVQKIFKDQSGDESYGLAQLLESRRRDGGMATDGEPETPHSLGSFRIRLVRS